MCENNILKQRISHITILLKFIVKYKCHLFTIYKYMFPIKVK